MSNRGFTIFFATLVTSLALAIGIAIYDLTVRELSLSATANESQQAIYAADSGAECALYWDTKCNLTGCTAGSAFPTSTDSTYPTSVICNNQTIALNSGTNVTTDYFGGTTTLTLTFPPQPFCANVTITKAGNRTMVTSHGQFNCTGGGVDQVERVLQVSY